MASDADKISLFSFSYGSEMGGGSVKDDSLEGLDRSRSFVEFGSSDLFPPDPHSPFIFSQHVKLNSYSRRAPGIHVGDETAVGPSSRGGREQEGVELTSFSPSFPSFASSSTAGTMYTSESPLNLYGLVQVHANRSYLVLLQTRSINLQRARRRRRSLVSSSRVSLSSRSSCFAEALPLSLYTSLVTRFGEQSAKKMALWTRAHLPSCPSPPTILDLGCGNGHFLFLLSSAKGGYPGSLLTGVDYSQGSVDLARLIGSAKARGEGREDSEEESESEEEEEDGEGEKKVGTEGEVRFEQGDVLLGEELKGGPWDLV